MLYCFHLREVDQKDKESFAHAEATQSFVGGISVGGGSNFNSIWNSYGSGIAEMVGLLKTNLYQLAPTSVSPKQSKNDDGSLLFGGETAEGYPEILKNLSSSKLSSSVANLRMWIAATILRRIVAEINVIDEAFKARGFSEIQIGSVGLERLKKTAENQQFVALHVPMLPLLIPFLELSSNQEYLVKRLKELAKSSCITDYRWNSGSSYNGVAWDEHLPTDSAIIFHLFCTYLDSQLRPLPSPGGRPFYNRYVVEVADKKSPKETVADVKNKCKCAILCTSPLKPKFNFICDEKIHNCAHVSGEFSIALRYCYVTILLDYRIETICST
jgi:Cytochrome B561, N terminal